MKWHTVQNAVLLAGVLVFAAPLGGCAVVEAAAQAACRAVLAADVATRCESLSITPPILGKG